LKTRPYACGQIPGPGYTASPPRKPDPENKKSCSPLAQPLESIAFVGGKHHGRVLLICEPFVPIEEPEKFRELLMPYEYEGLIFNTIYHYGDMQRFNELVERSGLKTRLRFATESSKAIQERPEKAEISDPSTKNASCFGRWLKRLCRKR